MFRPFRALANWGFGVPRAIAYHPGWRFALPWAISLCPVGAKIRLRIFARSVPNHPQLHPGAFDEPPTASKSTSLPSTGRQIVLCSRPRPRSKTFMNACNFVDSTSDRRHCESRMREIGTNGFKRRRARPVRPPLLYRRNSVVLP